MTSRQEQARIKRRIAEIGKLLRAAGMSADEATEVTGYMRRVNRVDEPTPLEPPYFLAGSRRV